MRVSTVEQYTRAFQEGQRVQVSRLCGRIVRGKRPEDFTTLTSDPNRKIVMLMGSDGLEMMPGKSGYEMLTTIGYTKRHIAARLGEGLQFKLAVFPESNIARPATWNNMIDMASHAYPRAAAPLRAHQDTLQKTSFADIEQSAGYTFADVDAEGIADPRYMTYERFLRSPKDLVAARALLYFTMHLRELYAGDGHTYTHDGRRGLQEYAIENAPISQLGKSVLLDITV